MDNDRYIGSQHETNGITDDDFSPKTVSYPRTDGTLALDSGTPPEHAPVTPANGCITSLIDFPALNERRKRTGKSFQTIADALDMSKNTVCRFFGGQSPNPSLYNTIRIFAFLGLSIDEAAGITKPQSPPIETSHDLLRKVEHLEYALSVKDEHITDLQRQLADSIEMRERYKRHFMETSERERAHYESEIDKIRARADKQFRLMFTLVIILLSVLIVYLITDLCLADRGLFQYNGLF